MKIFISSIILSFLLPQLMCAASNTVAEGKSKSGLELFFLDYDWDSMWAEVTATPAITMCKIEDSDDGGVYVNIIKFPLMNMILGNTSRGALVFEKGSIAPIYLGQFDPKKWDNIMALDLTPEKQLYASVRAQLASVVSCLAFSTLDLMSGNMIRTSAAAEKLKDVADSFFFATGCLGPTPTGTSTSHQDPIANGVLVINSIFYDMFSRKGAIADLSAKHTTQNVFNHHSKKILCKELINPAFPQSAYTSQLLYPTVGKSHELGVSPAEYNFHGAGESGINVFFVVNQRRDYAAFAYEE